MSNTTPDESFAARRKRLMQSVAPKPIENRDEQLKPLQPLHPNELVRWKAGEKFFGLKHSQLDEAIKRKLIPAPFALLEGGRAKAWLGSQILEYQAQRLASTKKESV